MKYLFPCSPGSRIDVNSDLLSRLDNDPEWIAEKKRNGIRCEAYRDDKLTLWTRHHTVIPEMLPTLRKKLFAMLSPGTVIDGELMGRRTKEIKELFYVFDILFYKGEPLLGLPWSERRKLLEKIVKPIEGLIEMSNPIVKGKRLLYHKAIEIDEGIVLKRVCSKYPIGSSKCIDNPYWVKVKKPGA